jgi:hypothetical protein
MNDRKSELKKNITSGEVSLEPVLTIPEGAVAASMWLRHSPVLQPSRLVSIGPR